MSSQKKPLSSREVKPSPEKLGQDLVSAVIRYDTQEALRLIEQGADLEWPDVEGSTPLVLAAYRCMTDVVDALLAAGADPEAKDRFGISAATWARSEMSPDTAAMIEEKIAKKHADRAEEDRKFQAWLDAGAPVKLGKVPRLVLKKRLKP